MRAIIGTLIGLAMLAGAAARASDMQSVAIDSQPSGATCTLTRDTTSLGSVVTPAVVQFNHSNKNVTVVCRKAGHFDGTGELKSDLDGGKAAGAFLLGGVLQVVAQVAAGSATLYQDKIVVSLEPHPPGYVAPATAPAVAAAAPLPRVPVAGSIGQEHRDVFDLGGVQVPLLEGTWLLAGVGGAQTPNAVSLVRLEQGQLWGIIRAWTATRPGGGYGAFGQCNRTDVLFTAVAANADQGDQDCWTINHALVAQSRTEQAEPHHRQSYEFLDTRGVATGGGLTLLTSVHRVATATGYVSVWYQVNPAFFGFPPSGATSWATSEWHRTRIAADPKRTAFIEAFKSLNAQYQDHVKAGFQRQLSGFTPRILTLADAGASRARLALDR